MVSRSAGNLRIAILGNSGSGKSSLARTLAALGRARTLDLDTVAWEPDRPTTARAESEARRHVHDFCSSNRSWVVEGCYANLIEPALAFEPKLILLNPGQGACLANCRARPWEPHKYASKQEQDANLEYLLSWVAEYYSRSGPMSLAGHRECFAAYEGPKRELRVLPNLENPDPKLLARVS